MHAPLSTLTDKGRCVWLQESVTMETEPEHIEELKKVCEELWEELQQRHNEVEKRRPVRPVTRDNAHLEIFHERERKLIAEIRVFKEKKPNILPKDRVAQRELLIDELNTSISQLQETLSVVTSEKKKMTEDIQRETELQKQLEAINAKLQEKVEDTPTEVKISQKRYLQELKDKEKAASVQQKQLMRKMANFLSEHFPLPTQHDVDQVKKRPNTRRKSDGTLSRVEVPVSELLPLQSILEMLMNKCLETPHDAYVMVDERFWQPYITVLLRCNIALQHPEDDRRIKLVPFHL